MSNNSLSWAHYVHTWRALFLLFMGRGAIGCGVLERLFRFLLSPLCLFIARRFYVKKNDEKLMMILLKIVAVVLCPVICDDGRW